MSFSVQFSLLVLFAVLSMAEETSTMLLQTRITPRQSLSKAAEAPTRILFVGNSFTYVHDLPHQLKHVAKSLGRSIVVEEVTVSGSFLLHTSTLNHTRDMLNQKWDYIVLQEFSLIPTMDSARDKYLQPALRNFLKHKKNAKVVVFMTWGYQDGLGQPCPYGGHYNIGLSLAAMQGCTTCPTCPQSQLYHEKVNNYSCMQYALARGVLSMLEHGADIVAPCGLAWQVAQGSHNVPDSCKRLVDAEYQSTMPVTVPLNTSGAVLKANPRRQLYIAHPDGTFDKHPSRAGQYFNALVFYATLFGESPVGAVAPLETQTDEVKLREEEAPLSELELSEFQELAFKSVQACGKACGLTSDQSTAGWPSEVNLDDNML